MTFHLLAAAAMATPLSAQQAQPAQGAQSAGPAPALVKAATTIQPDELARHIARLAADSLLGRDTPSPGLEKAAQYVAAQFQQLGLKPGAGNGTWLHRYPVLRVDTLDEGYGAWYRYPVLRDSAAPASTPTAPNVLGLLEGSDPALKHEYVVVMAHIDGIGLDTAKVDNYGRYADSIFNGADDNASGTAGLLELAKAFSQPGARPGRSLLFLAVSGQAKTFLGSRVFLAQPPVPLGQLVAVINLDMIGRNWRDRIVAVGEQHSTIGGTLERVVADHPELGLATLGDSLWPRARRGLRGFVSNSAGWSKGLIWDHHLFYSAGVPGVTFFNDYHVDYQEATDTPDAIDTEKAARVVRLAFYLGQELANAKTRPTWTPAGERARAEMDALSRAGLEKTSPPDRQHYMRDRGSEESKGKSRWGD